MSSVAVPISRVTPRSDASQSGSLVVGYELVVGCDNPMDRGADLRGPETTPGASAGRLVRAKSNWVPRLQCVCTRLVG